MQKEKLKLKLVLYFLLGLLFNFFGLVAGGLWIKFKTKTFKKNKFIALLVGVGLFIVLGQITNFPLVRSYFKNVAYSKFPELQLVDSTLSKSYPDYQISDLVRFNKSLGTEGTTSTLAVSLSSRNDLPPSSEMGKVSKDICILLHKENKTYDYVTVTFVKDNRILGIIGTTKFQGVTDDCKGYY